MSKIAITADSTVDLSPELVEKYNIKIIPLYIILGDETYLDSINVFSNDIYAYVDKTGKLPRTAAVTPAGYSKVFKELAEQGYDIIHINISSDFSSCYQNAKIAASEIGGNIYPVDSRNLSTGSGLLVIEAAEKAKEGWQAKDIYDYLNTLTAKVDASFIIDKLDYLYKGGRCSALAALGANLLKLKPCIEVKDGRMDVGKKYRGTLSNVLIQYTHDRLANIQVRRERVFITHAGMADENLIEEVKNAIKALNMFDEIYVTHAGGTISSHCGLNTLGVLFIRS